MKPKTEKNPKGAGRSKKYERTIVKSFRLDADQYELFEKKYSKKQRNERINFLIKSDVENDNFFLYSC